MTTDTNASPVPWWLVMGVSGTGKSSVARGLAQQLGGVFVEGDDYHPRRNIERMSQGIALTDEDRWPWLAAVAEAGWRAHAAGGAPVVIACSALKRRYRDFLRQRLPGLRVLFLRADEDLVAQRLGQRRDHFMGTGLLRSQFLDLEPPLAEEGVQTVDTDVPLQEVLARAQRIAAAG